MKNSKLDHCCRCLRVAIVAVGLSVLAFAGQASAHHGNGVRLRGVGFVPVNNNRGPVVIQQTTRGPLGARRTTTTIINN